MPVFKWIADVIFGGIAGAVVEYLQGLRRDKALRNAGAAKVSGEISAETIRLMRLYADIDTSRLPGGTGSQLDRMRNRARRRTGP